MKHIYINVTNKTKQIFRFDLQLHLLLSFFFSMFGLIWYPLVITGFIVTVAKESCDLWIKGHWSWDDFVFGIIGNVIAIIMIGII